MATSQSVLPVEGCSKLFKTFDIALKKSERHLILSTTYGLNNSWSKKITVGLRLRLDGTFEPVIRLVNNYSSGVSLSVAGWGELQELFGFIDGYFDNEVKPENKMSDLMNDTVTLGNCTLRLTTAHGSRVIAFYAKNIVEEAADDDAEEETEGPSCVKKPKMYTPVIVMQRSTFNGLKHITCCVNEHVSHLQGVTKDVNRCKDCTVEYFASVVVARKIKSPTLQQIGVVVCDEADVAREIVSVQFDGVFHDYLFNIVFLELLRLFLAYIIADIRQSVLTESTPLKKV